MNTLTIPSLQTLHRWGRGCRKEPGVPLIAERAFNPGLSQLSPESRSQRRDRTGLCTSRHPEASVCPTPSRSVSDHSRPLIPLQQDLPLLSHAQNLPAVMDGVLWLIGGKCGSHVWLSSSLQVAAGCDLLVTGILPPAQRALSSSDSWRQLIPAMSREEAETGKLRLL